MHKAVKTWSTEHVASRKQKNAQCNNTGSTEHTSSRRMCNLTEPAPAPAIKLCVNVSSGEVHSFNISAFMDSYSSQYSAENTQNTAYTSASTELERQSTLLTPQPVQSWRDSQPAHSSASTELERQQTLLTPQPIQSWGDREQCSLLSQYRAGETENTVHSSARTILLTAQPVYYSCMCTVLTMSLLL